MLGQVAFMQGRMRPILTGRLLVLVVVADRQLLLHVVKVLHRARRQVERVLDVDDVLAREGLVCAAQACRPQRARITDASCSPHASCMQGCCGAATTCGRTARTPLPALCRQMAPPWAG